MMQYNIPNPRIIDFDKNNSYEQLQTLEECDKLLVEVCGYDSVRGKGKEIFENVVADRDDKKIFTIDLYQSYDLEKTAEEILKNEAFDEYWRLEIRDRLDDDKDSELLMQWTPTFISEEVSKWLNKLSKTEEFYYIDFFKHILSKSDNEDVYDLIDFDNELFEQMPKVMRLY